MGRLAQPSLLAGGTPIALLAAVLFLSGLAGCVSKPEPRVFHVVRAGENVFRIAQRYGVPTEAVIRANDIRDVHSIPIGRRLWIPGARSEIRPPPGPGSAATKGSGARPCLEALEEAALVFAWPVRGKLTSRFGGRGRRTHEGIDLSAPQGTPVRTAEAGRVIHSGKGLGAYGNVIIIKHAGRWASVYAHNRRNWVPKGAFVEKGEVIAEVGSTGNASGPHLHFEIRRGDVPRDPLPCLG